MQQKRPTWRDLKKFEGCLKDEPFFQGTSFEILRKIRDEYKSST
jgi:hypothetical protein